MCAQGCISMTVDCLGSVDGGQVEEEEYRMRRCVTAVAGINMWLPGLVTSRPLCCCSRKLHRTQTVKLLKPVLFTRRWMISVGLHSRGVKRRGDKSFFSLVKISLTFINLADFLDVHCQIEIWNTLVLCFFSSLCHKNIHLLLIYLSISWFLLLFVWFSLAVAVNYFALCLIWTLLFSHNRRALSSVKRETPCIIMGWIMSSQSKHWVSWRDRKGNSGGSACFRKGRFTLGTDPLCYDRFVAM